MGILASTPHPVPVRGFWMDVADLQQLWRSVGDGKALTAEAWYTTPTGEHGTEDMRKLAGDEVSAFRIAVDRTPAHPTGAPLPFIELHVDRVKQTATISGWLPDVNMLKHAHPLTGMQRWLWPWRNPHRFEFIPSTPTQRRHANRLRVRKAGGYVAGGLVLAIIGVVVNNLLG